jgi:transcriptional regulator with XRE-family HTH domain
VVYFERNLRWLRKQKRITQAGMAEALGLKRTTVANYETGVSQPGFEVLREVARFYGVSVDDLLSRNMEREGAGEGFVAGKEEWELAEMTGSREEVRFWILLEQLKSIHEDVRQIAEGLKQVQTTLEQ